MCLGISISGGAGSLSFTARVMFDEFSTDESLVVVSFTEAVTDCFTDRDGTTPTGTVYLLHMLYVYFRAPPSCNVMLYLMRVD